jgi:arylsulfatase A-like enzyme
MRAMCLGAVVGLVALLCGCQQEHDALQRPWAGDAALESVTLAGKTMRARRLQRHPSVHVLPLGAVAPGELRLDAAIEGPPGSRLRIRLRQPAHAWPWSQDPPPDACAIDAATWQPCRLSIRSASSRADLEVRIEGPRAARGLIAAPLLRPAAAAPRPPVLLILVDTLRFDRIATYVPGFPLGTRLDELARDGVVFERAHSSSSWTRTAVATLLTGLDARTHRVLGRTDVLRAGFEGLPEMLQRHGWRTVAWSTNANVLPIWGFDAGFDVFVDLGALEWATNKTDAATVFTAVRDALRAEADLPSFSYIHLMDAHIPYQPPPEELAAVGAEPRLTQSFPGRREDAKAREQYQKYLAEIRDLDGKLGSFLDDLRAQGLYRNALILVAGDHGEEFLDHGKLYHGQTLYEEVLRVPVILKLPDNALAGTRIHQDVGLADLAPTIAGILGVGGFAAADGRDLWDGAHRRLRDQGAPQNALLELDTYQLGARVEDWRKLVVDYKDGQQLFDLHSDPHEEHDLLPAATAEASRLRVALDDQVARRASGWHVRACGGPLAQRVDLLLQADGALSGTDLEPADTLRRIDDHAVLPSWQATLELTPGKARREIFGKLVEEDATDEDEIVDVPAGAGTIGLRVADGQSLSYSLGTEQVRHPMQRLELSPADTSAIVAPSTPIHCWDASPYAGIPKQVIAARAPYLRIWYVPPPERKTELDPAIKERLRALGYSW